MAWGHSTASGYNGPLYRAGSHCVCVPPQELYLSYNKISDISLVAMAPSLEVLDVER